VCVCVCVCVCKCLVSFEHQTNIQHNDTDFTKKIVTTFTVSLDILKHTHTYINHFTALWTLFRTTQMCWYQKVHFAIFWIFSCKMKITQADARTIRMDCHPIQTKWCPHVCHPHQFYAGCPSWHNPPNLSWLGTGLHNRWLGCIPGGLIS